MIVWDAIRGLVADRSTLWPALIIPGIGIMGTEWLFQYLAAEGLRSMAIWLLKLPVYVLFAVSCHRVIILGRSYLPSASGVYWTMRETVFLGWTIGLGLLAATLSLLIAFVRLLLRDWADMPTVTWITDLTLYLFAAYFLMRFALVLPAAALEHRLSFADSWAATRGNGLVLAFAIGVPAFMELLAFRTLDSIIATPEALLSSVPYFIVALITTAFQIAVMSIAYKYLVFVSPSEGGTK